MSCLVTFLILFIMSLRTFVYKYIFLWNIFLRVGLLGHMVDNSIFNLLKCYLTLFQVVISFYIPSSVLESSNFFTTSPTLVKSNHTLDVKVASCYGFDLHSLITDDAEHVFMCFLENSCACWIFLCLLWESIYSDPLPMFKLDCLFLVEF